jgi:hypothetical protein
MKRARVDILAPNKKRGMTYQTDEKHITNLQEYCVGAVKLASYSLNTFNYYVSLPITTSKTRKKFPLKQLNSLTAKSCYGGETP